MITWIPYIWKESPGFSEMCKLQASVGSHSSFILSQGTRNKEGTFLSKTSSLMNIISFYDKVTQREATWCNLFQFQQSSHSILPHKMSSTSWQKRNAMGEQLADKVIENGTTFLCFSGDNRNLQGVFAETNFTYQSRHWWESYINYFLK